MGYISDPESEEGKRFKEERMRVKPDFKSCNAGNRVEELRKVDESVKEWLRISDEKIIIERKLWDWVGYDDAIKSYFDRLNNDSEFKEQQMEKLKQAEKEWDKIWTKN